MIVFISYHEQDRRYFRLILYWKRLPVYILQIVCDNGAGGEVSIVDRLFGPMFETLNEPEFFAKANVDQFGAVCWPNDTKLAPDPLYRKLIAH